MEAWVSGTARAPWFTVLGLPFSCPRPSSDGGILTTPMRRRSSTMAPSSPRPGASSRLRSRSVCRSGARERSSAQRHMVRHAGPSLGRRKRRGCSVQTASFSVNWSVNICVTTGRSTSFVSRQPEAARVSGLVVPTLLTWPGSAIVHDIKGENWQITAGFRAKLGPRPTV